MFTLTPKEMELMEILWDAGEPLGREEVVARRESRHCTWKPNSFHIIINRLMEKGAVEVTGVYQNGRKMGRYFGPTVSREEYYRMQVRMAVRQEEEQTGLPTKKILQKLLKEEKS